MSPQFWVSDCVCEAKSTPEPIPDMAEGSCLPRNPIPLSGELPYFLARYPRLWAWKVMMTSVIFRSRSSSRWARTPVRKKILLCPIRYRLGSSSKALIYEEGSRERKGSPEDVKAALSCRKAKQSAGKRATSCRHSP